MISFEHSATGQTVCLPCAIIEQWDFHGQTFATTLCAQPNVLPQTVFSVTHLGTGLAAVKQLHQWNKGPEEFAKIVAKYGVQGVLAAVRRGYMRQAPKWLVHIAPGLWIYDSRPHRAVIEVWANGKVAGTFRDMESATKLANVIKSLRPSA